MTGVYVFIAGLSALLVLSLIRLGAVMEYSDSGLLVDLRIAAFRIRVFPIKSPSNKKQKKPKAKDKTRPKGGLVDLFLDFLPVILDTAKRFKRKLRVDTLEMELTIAAPDPADTAMQYGQANALMASLWHPIIQVFHVKDGHAHIGIDFNAATPSLYLHASLSLTVGQILMLGAVFGIKALRVLIRAGIKQKHSTQREAV